MLRRSCNFGSIRVRRVHELSKTRTFRWFHLHSDVLGDLEARGLIAQVTSREKLQEAVKKPRTVYVGVDPTAEYLHVGHLLPLLCLFHFQLRGHKVIPLIGGATGLVGDPSGRNTERPLSDAAKVEKNVQRLSSAVEKFFVHTSKYALTRDATFSSKLQTPQVLSNLDWFKDIGLLEFLRLVGVHARVNTMIARESVQARLASQQGISFTEFTYQLLQAYDFYVLHKRLGCSIQIGGSDQWGNIVAGIDLINRITATESNVNPELGDTSGEKEDKAFGLTTPLLTTSSGAKFGKSAGNAVALDPDITSVFDFYQFFVRTADADVERYLKIFTLLSLDRIEEVVTAHQSNPEARAAQRLLASEVTEMVHGVQAVQHAQAATRVLYESDLTQTKAPEIIAALRGDPHLRFFTEAELLETTIAKLAVSVGLTSSNSAARQLVSARGLYLNNKPVQDIRQKLSTDDLLDGRLVILRSGGQKQVVLALSS